MAARVFLGLSVLVFAAAAFWGFDPETALRFVGAGAALAVAALWWRR